jgi:hypothetical protein
VVVFPKGFLFVELVQAGSGIQSMGAKRSGMPEGKLEVQALTPSAVMFMRMKLNML